MIFCSNISLPAITEEQRIILNAPITREEVLNAIKMLQNGKGQPQTLQDANISVILKKGKPPESCSSYRPIALLNVDRKVLANILAVCLEGILPLII